MATVKKKNMPRSVLGKIWNNALCYAVSAIFLKWRFARITNKTLIDRILTWEYETNFSFIGYPYRTIAFKIVSCYFKSGLMSLQDNISTPFLTVYFELDFYAKLVIATVKILLLGFFVFHDFWGIMISSDLIIFRNSNTINFTNKSS